MGVRLTATILLAVGVTAGAAHADEPATPEEVVAKVREAAAHLAENGEPGLVIFDQAESPFVWKDTYVFVYDCSADTIAAHPIAGTKGLAISTLADVDGVPFGRLLCEAAAAGGGWVEYKWAEPIADPGADQLAAGDPSRKVAFIAAVPGQPYQVSAGVYDDTLTAADLKSLIAE
ncbi:cache domain-containing protein [Bauldia sp.]|uniref:cache domain-containing protein n=1 Tax=Bauldia sp. TaxID=2575872 RepID=UPI003BACA55B